jgi:hypothetical protein
MDDCFPNWDIWNGVQGSIYLNVKIAIAEDAFRG